MFHFSDYPHLSPFKILQQNMRTYLLYMKTEFEVSRTNEGIGLHSYTYLVRDRDFFSRSIV